MSQNSDFSGKKLIYMLISVFFFKSGDMCSMRSREMDAPAFTSCYVSVTLKI